MASAADLRSLEDSCPWLAEDFRADLELLSGGTAAAARMYAADLKVIARMAGRVPRCPFDETGSTPWTSFRREVALARKVTDRGAALVVRSALRLTSVLPRALALLETGVLSPSRAEALVAELATVSDDIARQVDAELAHVLALLPVWRVEQEVRKAVLRLDPDAVAARVAAKNAGRGVELLPDVDDQAAVSITGPAVPLTRWYVTLDARARALKAAGDPRTLDALRFDLATSTYPCDSHAPADPTAPAADPTGAQAAVDNTPDPACGNDGPAAVEGAAGDGADAEEPQPAVDNTPDPTSGIDLPADDPADDPAGAPVGAPVDNRAGDSADDPAAADAASVAVDSTPDPASGVDLPADAGAGLRPSFVEAAPVDCRMSRPVQAHVIVPVETALGLSNEPGWLDGYGWLSAPTVRLLLVDAELRQVCAQTGTGELVDLTGGTRRPPPTPQGLRESLLGMVLQDVELSDIGWRAEPQHDPSARLREYVQVRDRFCDRPTGARVAASRTDLDHDTAWPDGPTAAWNLAARGRRTHQHKHNGWTPLRTATSTLWFSPAGQVVEVPRHTNPPPGIDGGTDRQQPVLPDPQDLADLDRLQLTAPTVEHPHLPAADRDRTEWTWLDGSGPLPF